MAILTSGRRSVSRRGERYSIRRGYKYNEIARNINGDLKRPEATGSLEYQYANVTENLRGAAFVDGGEA